MWGTQITHASCPLMCKILIKLSFTFVSVLINSIATSHAVSHRILVFHTALCSAFPFPFCHFPQLMNPQLDLLMYEINKHPGFSSVFIHFSVSLHKPRLTIWIDLTLE